MMPIQLSICIATLNRAAFIGATLDSIISQATDEVEIVIVDGASIDNTMQVVQKYERTFPRLRYVRLAAKGGVDQDYCKAVELAQGDYCWLMTDDDLLKPGAIQTVLNAIQHNFGLIIVNSEVRNADLSVLLEPCKMHLQSDRIYRSTDFQQLYLEAISYLSFIGCVVIKRQLWNQRERAKYFGTEFIHVGVIFQKRLPDDILVIAEPSIVIRYGNALWTSRAFQIWMFKWPELVWSFPDVPDSIKSKVCVRQPWQYPRMLLIERAKGTFTLKEYQKWLETRISNRWRRLIARLVAAIPGCIVNTALLAYFSVRYPNLVLLLCDLRNSRFYYRRYLKLVGGKST